ncbi:ribosomal-processing cysteine protease Prp [Enterococcus sp. AZ109]|uniref:ribosomal-processing cysteine protease Prp n=1 Tax=Enterococcus sp. AZ109 TaxID=2774634 RepID=UPI003F289011
MIQGTFTRNEAGRIVSFELSGHAQSGEYGHDIVCAAVSALAISTVNGIDALAGTQPIIDANEVEGGYLYAELVSGLTQEQTNITQILLENLLLGLQAIEEENNQFIQTKTIKQ